MERKRIGDLGELLSGAGAGADENCVENGREENVVEVEISCVAIILYYINNDLDWIGLEEPMGKPGSYSRAPRYSNALPKGKLNLQSTFNSLSHVLKLLISFLRFNLTPRFNFV